MENVFEISVFKSSKHFYAIVKDFNSKKIIKTFTTLKLNKKEFKLKVVDIATEVVSFLTDKKFSKIVFNRNGYRYLGNIKLFVEKIREKGVKI